MFEQVIVVYEWITCARSFGCHRNEIRAPPRCAVCRSGRTFNLSACVASQFQVPHTTLGIGTTFFIRDQERFACFGLFEKKIIKLEVEQEYRQMLMAQYPDPNDSGIDSDDTEAFSARARFLRGRASDSSSSDGDNLEKPWWPARNMKDNNNDEQNLLLWAQVENRERRCSVAASCSSPGRTSPPLYEVELTASDEDDDGSVLELVIPMQTSRYQRVPTSSPKKINPKPTSFFWTVFCCSRK